MGLYVFIFYNQSPPYAYLFAWRHRRHTAMALRALPPGAPLSLRRRHTAKLRPMREPPLLSVGGAGGGGFALERRGGD